MSVRILVGDCRERLRGLPEGHFSACVTSPPYFRQRDYGVDSQLGLEETPESYVGALVQVFREVRRVLRDDGVLWLNLGDSYAVSGRGGNPTGSRYQRQPKNLGPAIRSSVLHGDLKPKDLIGIPWMVAFALRADGWWLRGDHIWGKPNGMPESTQDRPSRAHEYVFLLTKSARYRFDGKAIRTAPKAATATRLAQNVEAQEGSKRANGGHDKRTMKAGGRSTITGSAHGRHSLGDAIPIKERRSDKQRGHPRRHAGFNDRWDAMERAGQVMYGANLRSVWWVPPAQFKDEHYAVMPDLVAEICIRSGCPAGGGVLDPFAGAGTTGLVADRLGRDATLIEANPVTASLARRRIAAASPLFAQVQLEM